MLFKAECNCTAYRTLGRSTVYYTRLSYLWSSCLMTALPVYMPLTCNHFVPDSPYSCAHDLLGSLVLGILVCAVHKFCSKFETPLHNSYSRCTCTCSSMGTEHANTCVPSQFRTDMSPRLLNNLAWLLTTCGAMTAMHNVMYESGSWELKDMTSYSACSTKYIASLST